MAIAPVSMVGVSNAAVGAKPTAKQAALKNTVDELVGTLFFGEVFKAMRNSKLKGAYGHGGRGEEVFTAQLHDALAKRMSHNARLGINEALYRRMKKLV
ncbi:MAG: rod-binding protein [Phycisphaerae bacterium]